MKLVSAVVGITRGDPDSFVVGLFNSPTIQERTITIIKISVIYIKSLKRGCAIHFNKFRSFAFNYIKISICT